LCCVSEELCPSGLLALAHFCFLNGSSLSFAPSAWANQDRARAFFSWRLEKIMIMIGLASSCERGWGKS
jgi:hypothetical protein